MPLEREGSTKISVDVVDDVLFVGPALRAAMSSRRLPVVVRRVETNWIVYTAQLDAAADVVVVRDELNDHVPTVLKARALARAGATPVVIAEEPTEAHVRRLAEAGARLILTREDSIDDLIAFLLRPEAHSPLEALPVDGVRLSDRELQVACLYAGRAAPSTAVLATSLGIPLSSTRTHLQRARAALSQVGPASLREQLRDRLVEGGWMPPPH